MYHSETCEEERGILITFKEEVKYDDLLIYTRKECCRDRYMGVCLYADGQPISCTPREMSYRLGMHILYGPYIVLDKEFTIIYLTNHDRKTPY